MGLSYGLNHMSCIQPRAATGITWKITSSHLPPYPYTKSQKVFLLPSLLYLIKPALGSYLLESLLDISLPPLCHYFSSRIGEIGYRVPSLLYGCVHVRVASTLYSNKLVWICNWIENILRAGSSSFIFAIPICYICWMYSKYKHGLYLVI